jgi:hypothetical protein
MSVDEWYMIICHYLFYLYDALDMHVILITILLNKVTKTNLLLSFVVWNLYTDDSKSSGYILYMTKALITMQFKAGLVSQLLHTRNMDSNPALGTGVWLLEITSCSLLHLVYLPFDFIFFVGCHLIKKLCKLWYLEWISSVCTNIWWSGKQIHTQYQQ